MGKCRVNGNHLFPLWAAAIVVVPLWRHAPWVVVGLAMLAVGVGIALMRERHRRRVRGFWVEYLSPNMLRAGDQEFAIVYHEGKESPESRL